MANAATLDRDPVLARWWSGSRGHRCDNSAATPV